MAVDIVEDIRLLQIVELIAAADETSRWEAAARQEVEEYRIRHEPRHRDDAPPGRAVEDAAQFAEIGDALGGDFEAVQPVEVRGAGAADQQSLLPLEQQPPDRVLLSAVIGPVLLDDKLGGRIAHRGASLCHAFEV